MIGRHYHDDEEDGPTAATRHLDLLREFGQIGPDTVAQCRICPEAETLTVYRDGPKALPSTLVGVSIEGADLYLSPADARRIGAAFLTAADEAEGSDPLALAIPDDLSAL